MARQVDQQLIPRGAVRAEIVDLCSQFVMGLVDQLLYGKSANGRIAKNLRQPADIKAWSAELP
jgi:hypothetical protein